MSNEEITNKDFLPSWSKVSLKGEVVQKENGPENSIITMLKASNVDIDGELGICDRKDIKRVTIILDAGGCACVELEIYVRNSNGNLITDETDAYNRFLCQINVISPTAKSRDCVDIMDSNGKLKSQKDSKFLTRILRFPVTKLDLDFYVQKTEY